MAGFRNLKAWPDAETLGQFHITSFRKAVSSTATTTSAWIDYSYFPGSPTANFYASAPLEAAYVEAARGIYVPTVSPKTQWLRNLKLMSAASSGTSTLNGRQQIVLADLLMYYPFVDTDAVGEQQDMIQTVSLPRYTSGNVTAALNAAGTFAGVADWSGSTTAIAHAVGSFAGVAAFEAIRYATGSIAGSFAPAVTLEAAGFSGYLLDQEDIETGLTLRQALRLVTAATAGKISGGGTATVTIRNAVADGADRIVAEVDSAGNRTAITYSLD